MYYLEKGLGQKWLAICFAFFGAMAAFGIGNMVQANTTAHALSRFLGINSFFVGGMMMLLTAMVIIGGIKRIADTASY